MKSLMPFLLAGTLSVGILAQEKPKAGDYRTPTSDCIVSYAPSGSQIIQCTSKNPDGTSVQRMSMNSEMKYVNRMFPGRKSDVYLVMTGTSVTNLSGRPAEFYIMRNSAAYTTESKALRDEINRTVMPGNIVVIPDRRLTPLER